MQRLLQFGSTCLSTCAIILTDGEDKWIYLFTYMNRFTFTHIHTYTHTPHTYGRDFVTTVLNINVIVQFIAVHNTHKMNLLSYLGNLLYGNVFQYVIGMLMINEDCASTGLLDLVYQSITVFIKSNLRKNNAYSIYSF